MLAGEELGVSDWMEHGLDDGLERLEDGLGDGLDRLEDRLEDGLDSLGEEYVVSDHVRRSRL